jgi:hypothetical protein
MFAKLYSTNYSKVYHAQETFLSWTLLRNMPEATSLEYKHVVFRKPKCSASEKSQSWYSKVGSSNFFDVVVVFT